MNKLGYIYKITNPSGRVYVGQTFDLKDRVRKYRTHSVQKQPKIYKSLLKYGWENHLFEILEKGLFSREEIDKLEIHYIQKFNCTCRERGMNVMSGGHATGFHSEETKLQMSESARNRSEEWSKAVSYANSIRVHGKETRAKMSKSKKGIPLKPEHAAKVAKVIEKQNWKIVLNTSTGVFYENGNEAATAHLINRHTLKNKLNGS